MKRIALVLAVLLMFALTASAQSQIKPVFYAGGGLGMPLSPEAFKDGWKMGLGFGGGVGAQFTPNIEVIGKFFYNTFGLDVPDVEGVTIDGGDLQFIEFGADMKYLFTTGQIGRAHV